MTASLKHKQNEWTENVCANHAREMLFFEEIYTAEENYTATGAGTDKSHLCA